MDKRAIRIDSPCTLDWQKMTPADKGRFCGDCKKVVRDLSSMREDEARALLRQPAQEGLCVRFLHDRDGQILFANDSRLLSASLLSKTKRAAMMAAAVAVPLALQACSAPLSGLGIGDDTVTSDTDSGVGETMGGVAYEPDAGTTNPPDAALDAAPDAKDNAQNDAGADVTISDTDAAPDGGPI